jgi:glycosyltransferase involved in cell wall biosynthesis
MEKGLTKNPVLITIITPSFNRASMIGQAIESVMKQDYFPIEHLIIDAASTDDTLGTLARFPHLKVVSEPDSGIYAALNKGLALARGEIVGFLNTDDLYAPDILKEIAAYFDNSEILAVVGRAVVFRPGQDGNTQNVREIIPACADDLLERTTLGNPAINAWFFRRSVFDRIGAFDAGYKIIGDREFMLRLALAGTPFARTDRLVYRYCIHDGSLTFNENKIFLPEIIQEHLKMTDVFLRKAGLSAIARQYLRKMRTRDTLMMAVFCLHKWDLGQTWFYAREGIRSDWVWPLKFTIRVLGRLVHSFSRRVSGA